MDIAKAILTFITLSRDISTKTSLNFSINPYNLYKVYTIFENVYLCTDF